MTERVASNPAARAPGPGPRKASVANPRRSVFGTERVWTSRRGNTADGGFRILGTVANADRPRVPDTYCLWWPGRDNDDPDLYLEFSRDGSVRREVRVRPSTGAAQAVIDLEERARLESSQRADFDSLWGVPSDVPAVRGATVDGADFERLWEHMRGQRLQRHSQVGRQDPPGTSLGSRG